MDIRPLKNKILIEEVPWEKVSKGGIYIPDTAKDGQYAIRAKVISVGPGKVLEDGQILPPAVKAGDTVLLGKHHGAEVKMDGETYRIVPEEVIEAVLDET